MPQLGQIKLINCELESFLRTHSPTLSTPTINKRAFARVSTFAVYVN